MIIAEPLKQALIDTGISAAELARRMNVSKSYVSQLASGKLGATEETLHQIAQHLGCRVSVEIRFEKIE